MAKYCRRYFLNLRTIFSQTKISSTNELIGLFVKIVHLYKENIKVFYKRLDILCNKYYYNRKIIITYL